MPATAVICDTPLSLEIEHLEASVCDSATFRTIVADPLIEWRADHPSNQHADVVAIADELIAGADVSTGREDAAARVAWYEVDEELDPEDVVSVPPRAIIRHGESSVTHLGGLSMRQGGFLVLLIELPVPEAYTKPRTQAQRKQLFKWGLSLVGRIQREVMAVQFTAGRLAIDRMELDPSEVGVYDRQETARPEDPDVFYAIFKVFHQGL